MRDILSTYDITKKLRAHSKILLLLILVVYVSLWVIHPKLFIASDPWAYAGKAFNITQGTFFEKVKNHPFDHRLAVTVPVAIFYEMFGISSTTTYLWSLVNALVIIAAVWFVMPADSSRIIATLLAVSAVPLFKSSTTLLPDVVATSFMFLSSILLYFREKVLTYRTGWIWLTLLVTVSLFIAFLSKLSAYWVLLLWVLCLLYDFAQRKFKLIRKFYVPVVGWGVILGSIYLSFSQVVWGDYFARLSSVQELTGYHLWSWNSQSNWDLVKRLTFSPAKMLVMNYGIVTILFFFGLFVVPKSLRFWAGYTVTTLLFFWFGSTSLTQYEPMPLVPRMVLPALPGLCIVGGYFGSCVQIQVFGDQTLNKMLGFIFIMSLTFLPMANHVQAALRMPTSERDAIHLVKQIINSDNSSRYLLISSDERSYGSLAFYFGFTYPQNLSAVFIGNTSSKDISQYDKIFVFVHTDRSEFLESAYGVKHFDIQILKHDLPKLYAADGIYLFYPVQPHQVTEIINPE